MKMKAMVAIMVAALLGVSASCLLIPYENFAQAAQSEKAEKGKDAKSSNSWFSRRFRSLDPDGDGKVTKDEYMKPYEEQFKQIDADSSKTLSPDEVDFPPGTPLEMRDMMRKQMQEDEAREERMRIEMEKRHEEDMKRMQEEEKARQEADAARRAEEEKPSAVDSKDKMSKKKAK